MGKILVVTERTNVDGKQQRIELTTEVDGEEFRNGIPPMFRDFHKDMLIAPFGGQFSRNGQSTLFVDDRPLVRIALRPAKSTDHLLLFVRLEMDADGNNVMTPEEVDRHFETEEERLVAERQKQVEGMVSEMAAAMGLRGFQDDGEETDDKDCKVLAN